MPLVDPFTGENFDDDGKLIESKRILKDPFTGEDFDENGNHVLPPVGVIGTAKDMLTEAKMGVGGMYSGGFHAGALLADSAGMPNVRDKLEGWSNQASERTNAYRKDLSQRQNLADQQKFIESTGPDLLDVKPGPGLTDWRTIAGQAAQSMPGTYAGMGAGYLAARGIAPIIGAALPGASSAAIEGTAGAIGFGLGEGAASAPSDAKQVYDAVLGLDETKLSQSPLYQQALASLGDPSEARKQVALTASKQTMWDTGIATTLLGAPMGAVFGRMFGASGVSASRVKNLLLGMGGEGAQEFVQSGAEQYLQNKAVQENADPSQNLSEGVANQAVGGAVSGAVMGAGPAMLANTNPASLQTTPNTKAPPPVAAGEPSPQTDQIAAPNAEPAGPLTALAMELTKDAHAEIAVPVAEPTAQDEPTDAELADFEAWQQAQRAPQADQSAPENTDQPAVNSDFAQSSQDAQEAADERAAIQEYDGVSTNDQAAQEEADARAQLADEQAQTATSTQPSEFDKAQNAFWREKLQERSAPIKSSTTFAEKRTLAGADTQRADALQRQAATTLPVIAEAVTKFANLPKGKYESFLRDRMGKKAFAERAGEIEQAWTDSHPAQILDSGKQVSGIAGNPQIPPSDSIKQPVSASVAPENVKPVEQKGPEGPAIGMTRLYHGSATRGRYHGKAWFSTSREYAANYRDGAELQYVDYPTAKLNEIADPDGYGQTVDKGFTANLELDSSETGLRKPVEQKGKAESIADVATKYAKELGQEPSQFHEDFAEKIAKKDAYGLKFLANGLNDKGKKVFSQVTGVKLPKQQGETWKAIRAWGGITEEQDATNEATRKAVITKNSAENAIKFAADNAKRVVMSADGMNGKDWIEKQVADGFTELRSQKVGAKTNYFLVKPGESSGYNLTKKGSGAAPLWKYARAYLDAKFPQPSKESVAPTPAAPQVQANPEVARNEEASPVQGRQQEGRSNGPQAAEARQEEVTTPEAPAESAPSPRSIEDQLVGVKIRIPVHVEETGQTVHIEMDAHQAYTDSKSKIDRLRALKRCVDAG